MLVAMVVGGISLVVAAIHLSGGSRTARFDDTQAAVDRFSLDFPNESAVHAWLTADRRDAFLALASGDTGLVHAVGDRFLTRVLDAGSVRGVTRDGAAGLAVAFADFTYPQGRFVFDDPAAADAVATRLAAPGALPAREAA